MNTVDMCRREKELTLDFVLNIDKWKTVNLEVQQLVEKIGYDEGMKVVIDPGVILPKEFIEGRVMYE